MRYVMYLFLASLFCCEVIVTNGQEESSTQADFTVEAFVSNDRPFVGEQIEYVFRFRAYQPPPDLTDELPEFDGFWLVEIPDVEDLGVETVEGRQYYVGERRVVLSPMQEGSIIIGPATLILPETVFREGGRFSTNPIPVSVQPLPPGAPPTFTGAVGQFHADIVVDQTTVLLGQPITLTMVVTGAGNLESLRAPDLHFPDGWRVYTNPTRYSTSSVSDLRVGEKIFEWLVVPERTGSTMFPEVEFVFFNPRTGQYHSLIMEQVSISVLPGGDSLRELPVYEPGEVELPPLTLKAMPDNLRSGSPGPGMILWILWILVPILPVASAMWVLAKRYQMRRQLIIRRSAALRQASRRLRLAGKEPRAQASEQIAKAIQGYLADRLGCSIRSFPETPIDTILGERQVASDVTEALLDSLKRAEAMRFIPSEFEIDVEPVIQQALAALVQLDRIWTSS